MKNLLYAYVCFLSIICMLSFAGGFHLVKDYLEELSLSMKLAIVDS